MNQWLCPKCKAEFDDLHVVCEAVYDVNYGTAGARPTGNPSEMLVDWNDDSRALCPECAHASTVLCFDPN